MKQVRTDLTAADTPDPEAFDRVQPRKDGPIFYWDWKKATAVARND